MMARGATVGDAGTLMGNGSVGCVQRGTVLVVEDTSSVLSMLTMILRRQGYRTLAAEDAEEALDLLAAHDPDVVITDVDLPGMNGISLCGVIQEVLGQPVHIILLSGRCQHIVDGLDAGAADFVCKPFVSAELLARVASGMRTVQRQKGLLNASSKLQRSFDALRKDSERIGRDLGAAAELQAGLMPPPVMRCNGFVMSCAVRPECVLSGDMIGAIARASGEVAMYAVDVSGSGTPAALLATSIALDLRGDPGELRPGASGPADTSSASEVVSRLNRRFVDFANSERYSTIAYAVIDVARQHGEVCIAGHPRPALISSDGTVRFIGDGGTPVGMFEDTNFETVAFDFRPGERLVLFSDGFIEARLPGGMQVGYQGMAELLGSLAATPDPAIAAALVDGLGRLLGRTADDDVSVISAAYDGIGSRRGAHRRA